MRCQYVHSEAEHPCVRAGMWKQLVRLPTGDHIIVMLCHAHNDAVGAIQWAERKRDTET